MGKQHLLEIDQEVASGVVNPWLCCIIFSFHYNSELAISPYYTLRRNPFAYLHPINAFTHEGMVGKLYSTSHLIRQETGAWGKMHLTSSNMTGEGRVGKCIVSHLKDTGEGRERKHKHLTSNILGIWLGWVNAILYSNRPIPEDCASSSAVDWFSVTW